MKTNQAEIAKIISEHDQYKCMCMGFLESAYSTEEGVEFIEALQKSIANMEKTGKKMSEEHPDLGLLMITTSRFAYMGILATMDGLATRINDEESKQDKEESNE